MGNVINNPAGSENNFVTLNIGGRNTNPLEFILEGDESDIGRQVVQMGTRHWLHNVFRD